MLTSSFEYVLPAIRGIQAGREYYVSMCPVRFLPKLFPGEVDEMPPEMRAQRSLNRSRVLEISRYILNHRHNYIFSAIAASIDGEIAFEASGNEAEARKVGRLRVPMDARFSINDGQHRKAAFELALKENPALGYETVAIIFFVDIGLKRSQQMFRDLNSFGVSLDQSLSILYDHCDQKAELVRNAIAKVEIFRCLTDCERASLPKRSGKLFTLNSIYNATLSLLANHLHLSFCDQVELAARYWNAVSLCFPEWELVRQRKISASEIRQDYLHSHAIAIAGLGEVGATLISTYPDDWENRLVGLTKIDWLRSNQDWQNQIIVNGNISKSRNSLMQIKNYLKKALDLPVIVEDDGLE